jgi:hypothetical protein
MKINNNIFCTIIMAIFNPKHNSKINKKKYKLLLRKFRMNKSKFIALMIIMKRELGSI